tara:strand:- start:14786 stop:15487 length:702 start_codon:yes stop_codon:yes gene_type:complete
MKHIIAFVAGVFTLVSTDLLADQSVYINQTSGENLSVTISQSNGNGNIVAASGDLSGVDSYFVMNGDDQTWIVDQIGSANVLSGSVISSDMFNFTLNQFGDNNEIDILGNIANFADLNLSYTGNNNTMVLDLGGAASASYTNLDWIVTGDYNTVVNNISADGALQDIDVSGSYNAFQIDQTGYGDSIDFHEIYLDMIGDNNQVDIMQDTTLAAGHIDLVINGSNAVIDITQSD